MKKLLIALLVCSAGVASAQKRPTNLSNSPQRSARGFTDANEELPARNHGTGLHVGTVWGQARAAVRGEGGAVPFEIGAFHQLALSERVSVQGEALLYRDVTPLGRSSGLRLPALLVLNPFYNVSVHVGPQMQLRTGGTATPSATLTADDALAASRTSASRLTAALAVGGEARVGFMRVGLRYTAPFEDLYDLKAAGRQVGRSWQAGQVNVYLGAGF